MIFSTFITLLPVVALAAPTALQVRASESCAPTSYTVSDFSLSTSESTASVMFNFKSTFDAESNITDIVTTGATCSATGDSIPNNNECQVPARKLLFDLAGPQGSAKYRVTHFWVCNR